MKVVIEMLLCFDLVYPLRLLYFIRIVNYRRDLETTHIYELPT
jgi:hypothetical protein